MLAEFLAAWKNEVVAAMRPQVQAYDRKQDRLVTMPGGESQTIPGDVPDRAHVAGNLDAIRQLVETHVESGTDPEVWFNRSGVTVIFDPDKYRRDRATMSLEFSPEILKLREIAKTQWTQQAIISLLRIQYKVCDFHQAIQTLRNVKFEIGATNEATIERTKVSIGKSQLAKMYGLDALQDELVFTIPIFASKFRQYFSIAAALEPDPESRMFAIVPFPGQIEGAIEKAEQALGDELRGMLPDVPVFFGQP